MVGGLDVMTFFLELHISSITRPIGIIKLPKDDMSIYLEATRANGILPNGSYLQLYVTKGRRRRKHGESFQPCACIECKRHQAVPYCILVRLTIKRSDSS